MLFPEEKVSILSGLYSKLLLIMLPDHHFSSMFKVPIHDSEVSIEHVELGRKKIQPQSQRIEMREEKNVEVG